MPAGNLKLTVSPPEDFENLLEFVQYLAGFTASNFRELNWLTENLDTVNIKEINAGRIYTGILNAGKVTIKSALAEGATITLNKDGIKLTYLSGMSITLNEKGFTTTYPSGVSITINEDGFTIKKDDAIVFTVDNDGNGDYKGAITVGASINVDNDVYIGDTLFINPVSFGAGIRWAAVGGNIDIFIDPAGKALNLTAPNGVKLNGVNVVSSLSSLEARVAALEARPIYVPPPTP